VRALVVLAGVALSCAHHSAALSLPADNTPSPEKRIIDWCERAYPWPDGPLTAVTLRACSATYQEAPNDLPGELAVWTWRLGDVRYEADGKIAVVTLTMRQTIGSRAATFSRTYRFRCDGEPVALVRAEGVVPVNTNDGEFSPRR